MVAIASFPSAVLPQPRPLSVPPHASTARVALHDSTNTGSRSRKRSIGHTSPYSTKRVALPTSSARLPQEFHTRCSRPSPRFPLAHKAPPTVSISLSAACSGIGFDANEPELPDVRNVVPFPCSPSDGDRDVEMLDGTPPLPPHSVQVPSIPCTERPTAAAPSLRRKRRSACSITSSSTATSSTKDRSGKDPKDGAVRKKARKSRQHLADMWWLGVMHRSILQGLCEPAPVPSSCPAGAGTCENHGEHLRVRRTTIEAQDRLLAGRIWKKLVGNGWHSSATTGDTDRKTTAPLPSRLAIVSSPPAPAPSVLMPSPIIMPSSSAPTADIARGSSDLHNMPLKLTTLNEVAILDFPRPPSQGPNSLFGPRPSVPITLPAPSKVYDDFPALPGPTTVPSQSRLYAPQPFTEPRLAPPSVECRQPLSPSLRAPTPPLSRPTTPTPQMNPSTLTLTMPQLVASLTLAHRERSGSRTRGRSMRGNSPRPRKEKGKDAPLAEDPASQEGGVSVDDKENGEGAAIARAATPRRSPLYHVAYTENS
ncbi:hypothetical protein ID866_10437 [Astraeus odoratus]|nr:hypothetical protein ID866_10437 [Astraeus odoratus]